MGNTALKCPGVSYHHFISVLAIHNAVRYSKRCSSELLEPWVEWGSGAAGRMQLDGALTATLIRAGGERWHLMRGVGDICSHTRAHTYRAQENEGECKCMEISAREDTHSVQRGEQSLWEGSQKPVK